jgi:hypothetical protein
MVMVLFVPGPHEPLEHGLDVVPGPPDDPDGPVQRALTAFDDLED